MLEARTQASVAVFKLGAHSATLRPERIWRAMKFMFKVLLRAGGARGGGRRERSGEQNDVGKLCIKYTVGSTARNQECEVSSPSRAKEWRGPGRAHAFAWEAG